MKKGSRKTAFVPAVAVALVATIVGVDALAAQPKPAAPKRAAPKAAQRAPAAKGAPASKESPRDQTLYGQEKIVTRQERMDRAVDVVAVASRETAITNLKRLLKIKKGTKDEPALIWRLADMEWRSSKNYFRVGMTAGEKDDANRKHDLLLQNVVIHTTDLLVRFPKFKDIREVLLRRGRAYEELKKKEFALKDYLDYIGRYPEEPQTVSVRLMATDVMKEFKQHSEILRILKPVDLTKSHGGLVRDVVERQAMANFNVENYPEALRKAEWLLNYDRRRNANLEKGSPYDDAIAMAALFYGTAFEKRLAGYSLDHALDYFRKLERGLIVGRLSHEFILVMRAKEMQAEVVEWKDVCLRKTPQLYDTLTSLVDVYDAVLNWKIYAKFSEIEKDFGTFFGRNPGFLARAQQEESFVKFKKSLLEFADKLYATLPKQPNESDYRVIGDPYLKSLNAYMRITDPKDVMKGRVRFRIGEFYLGLKDWDRAQQAFTEVYQAKLFPVESKELRDQARMKAMAARYDSFKEKGVIPKDLKAVALNSPKKALPGDVAEWIRWVDEVAAEQAGEKKDEKDAKPSPAASAQSAEMTAAQIVAMDQMLFEANRLIYAYSDVELAYKRMLHYVGTRPSAKMTPATCALIMDTLIQSEAWVATRTLAIKFQKMPNVAVGEFKTKLEQLEQESHLKITQNFFKTKDYEKVIVFGDEHLKLYPSTKKKVDIYSMMGKAALELKKIETSLAYMNEVIKLDPNHATIGVAYFVRAQDHEKNFRFKEAFEDFYKVYKLPADRRGMSEQDLPALRKKLFVMGLTSDDESILRRVAEAPELCGAKEDGDLRVECDRLAAMQIATDEDSKRTAWELVETGDRARRESKAAWYAAALSRGHQLPNSVIRRVVEDLQKTLPSLDPMTQMEVLSSLNVTVPRLYEKKVETVETISKIDRRIALLKDSLEKRVREVAGLENLAGGLVLLPSPEIRVKVLTRLAHAYQKVADELKAVPIPKDFQAEEADVLKQAIANMVGPLEKKFAILGSQVWEVAKAHGLASFWMDETAHQLVSDLYADAVTWKEKDAFLDALSDDEKGGPWVKAVKDGHKRSMIFYYQLSQTPAADRLALTENGKALLQFATLSALNLDSVLLETAKDKETKVEGEALRLSLMARLYRHVRSRSYESIKAVRTLFLEKGFDEESREEDRILTVATEHEKRYSEMIAKQEAEAKAKAEAEAAAKLAMEKSKQDAAKNSRVPATKPAAPADANGGAKR